MTKVNKKFIEGMQAELDRKAPEYDGRENPRNYKNMKTDDLIELIYEDTDKLWLTTDKLEAQKLCVDIANRCSMVWEKLEKE